MPFEMVLSAPGCANAANIIAEDAVAPPNATAIRVQHIGDLGTPELAQEISNPVTWDVGTLSGLHAPQEFQRGYRDLGPPVASSAFQLQCDSAGFLINTWTFAHTLPLVGEGPSASVSRDLIPEAAPFRDAGSSFSIEARVAVPWIVNQATPVTEGAAQVSFFYYARDTRSGTSLAHVIGLWENRPPGTNGSAIEFLGNDGVVAFAGSPLAATDSSGAMVRFVGVAPSSAPAHFVQPLADATFFRADISYARFRDMLDALRRNGSPALSPDPADYRITLFGVLGEVFPGTGGEHNVAVGANVSALAMRQAQSP
jgi:hypothetical protein